MNVVNFCTQNFDSILMILGVIIAVFARWKHENFQGIRQMLFSIITDTEEKYGPGMGLLKKAEVAERIWSHIPPVLQIIVTQKDVENLIEKALDDARGRWAQSAALQEYIEHNNTPETTAGTTEK